MLNSDSTLDPSQLPAAFGHGTMVAGIVHLVAPTARIMPLKAFTADGTSRTFDIVRAIYYAVDHGARVINMSFSAAMPSPEIARAINYATDRGVICVASAGNLGREVVVYPGGFRNVLRRRLDELGEPAGAQLVQQLRRCAREPGRARRRHHHHLSWRRLCGRLGHVVQHADRRGRRGAVVAD